MVRRRSLAVALLVAVLCLSAGRSPSAGATAADCGEAATQSTGPTWLSRLNEYRALAGLDAVAENPEWSCGARRHAQYIVKNDLVSHAQDPANQWYSSEGNAAGRTGNVAGSHSLDRDELFAIDAWMQAPFHAVGMLDPRLRVSAFGSYREDDGGVVWAGVLDILRGVDRTAQPASYPIAWPGDGTSVPLSRFTVETPDPLSSCPDFQRPAGLPILLLLGDGATPPAVATSSFEQDGKALEHCRFDETSYANPDPAGQALGRAALAARNAIVLVPREPLTPGGRYTVSIDANGETYRWSFVVDSAPRDRAQPFPRAATD